jgi:ABC-type lipoprotein export system ATPase subunit
VKPVEQAAQIDTASSARADDEGVALGYDPAGGDEGRVRIPAGGFHQLGGLSDSQRKRLVSAVLDLRPELGARLVLLGADVDSLRPRERAAFRDRIAFMPASGGLLSNLNAWENIVLPIGFHRPWSARGIAAKVYELLGAFDADPHALLDKLPERMSLYERKLTGYVRIALEKPDLVLAEDLQGGLESAERAAAAGFPAAYLESCPGGTFVQLEITSGP